MAADAPLRCQELVVGSGPGGSITACLLAARGRDVVIVEDGPDLPLESCPPFSVEEMLQKYRSGGLNVALGNPKVAYVEGRVAGGGSEINAGLYHRIPEETAAAWGRDYGAEALDAQTLEPHYAAVERALSVGKMPTRASRMSIALAEGAGALGWKALEVPRWARYNGTVDSEGVAQGERQSMSRTYLHVARQAGAKLIASTRVRRLRRQDGGWVAECAGPGGNRQIRAGHVFVCAGAVHTPLLLRNSGLTHNIGNSLAMHPTVKVLARFPDAINNGAPAAPVHQVKEFSPRMSFGCSISTLPYAMLSMADYPAHRARIREQVGHTAIYYAMVTGPATGRIRAVPFCPDPLIRYPIGPGELTDLALGLQRLCRLLFAAGAVELFPSVAGMEPLQGPDDLSRLPASLPAKASSLVTLHVFSSCPMGENRQLAACDSLGRVHGVAGLSVHDASLLCTAPGVNPQGSLMVLAHRNTTRYLESV